MKYCSVFSLLTVLAWGPVFLPHISGLEEKPSRVYEWPLLFCENFDEGTESWQGTDPDAWKVISEEGNRVFSLFKASDYEPPVRSPYNIALLKGPCVSDFVLEARIKSTSREYGHRDMCVIFGWQSPSLFYYAHIASKADAHANSIFIVNDKPRVSIADERTDGTKWVDGRYHTVRLTRNTQTGTIQVYFDDLSEPIMVAVDKTFISGHVGFGSFDDTGNLDDVRIWGIEAKCPGDGEEK